ncbi:MAG: FAD-dependent oxidoreductase [Rivularia sp. (in: cyanobacteria)]
MVRELIDRENHSKAFPKISEEKISELAEFAECQSFNDGETLVKAGEKEKEVDACAIFVFIGAKPHTDWLPKEIETDEKGFIKTGLEVKDSPSWTGERQPFFLETSCEGIFAAGDVRCESIKRVASAVGEGSMAVKFVHKVLKE